MDNVTVIVNDVSPKITVQTVAGGIKGDKGDAGLQGIQGEQGITGDTGIQGIQGIQGLKGDDYASTQIPNVILSQVNWSLVGGFWEYDYANVLILSTSLVNIVPYKETIDYVKFADIMPMVVSGVGTVKIYAVNQPLGDINVNIEII
mgnify:FL=1